MKQSVAMPLFEGLEGRRFLSSSPVAIPVVGETGGVTASATTTALSWSRTSASPIPRYESQRAAVGNYIYHFGGFQNGKYQASLRVDRYDTAKNTWTRMKDLPNKVTHGQTVVVDGKIWLMGGFIGDNPGKATNQILVFDPAKNSWSVSARKLPTANGAGGAAVVGNTLVYFGGQLRTDTEIEAGNNGSTWTLDLSNPNSKWQRKGDLNKARNHLGGVALNGYVYSIGGQTLREWTSNVANVERFDLKTGKWTTVASLPEARGHTNEGSVVAEGKIYVFGGSGNTVEKGNNVRSSVFRYDPATNKWTKLNDLPVARKNTAAAYVNGTFYIAGGGIQSGPTSDAFKARLTTPSTGGGTGGGTTSGASISGFLWNDGNGDGKVGSSESRTGSRTVFLDSDRDGKLDSGEKRVTSDASGNYKFTGLAAGTYYVSREFPSGFRLSNSSAKYITVTVTANQAKTGVNLGTTDRPVARAAVYSTTAITTKNFFAEDDELI